MSSASTALHLLSMAIIYHGPAQDVPLQRRNDTGDLVSGGLRIKRVSDTGDLSRAGVAQLAVEVAGVAELGWEVAAANTSLAIGPREANTEKRQLTSLQEWVDECHAPEGLNPALHVHSPPPKKYFNNDFGNMVWLHWGLAGGLLVVVLLCCLSAGSAYKERKSGGESMLGRLCSMGMGILWITAGGLVFGCYQDQCNAGNGPVMTFEIHRLQLIGPPTDADSEDEITIHASCGMCSLKTDELTMKAGQIRDISFTINTFFNKPFEAHLVDADEGFEGADDESEKYFLTSEQLAVYRHMLYTGQVEKIDIMETVVVKGGNIFSENPLLGFISDVLCVSAVDFVLGPWLGKILKVGMPGSKVLGKVGGRLAGKAGEKFARKLPLQAGGILPFLQAYDAAYAAGKVSRMDIAKLMINHQLKGGFKAGVKDTVKWKVVGKGVDAAMNQTAVDEYLDKTMGCYQDDLWELYTGGKSEGRARDHNFKVDALEAMEQVYKEINDLAATMAQVYDTLEVCLNEMFPTQDANYRLYMRITMANIDEVIADAER
eukprot:gnl/MRDRNA2_/MRDRNA2_114776_c0_seq1.p1 gnl/MRDRNA2_/MRDRNA2_114776_c0~~gnl/MRDRNA2_/MRDRNA2_114776_c0_seq1.p1  ORF type:complete len:545 (-),score=92.78 gnl/MRDRNA2_/MRDRNA2_114776_c0_seq1:270-1904(-)